MPKCSTCNNYESAEFMTGVQRKDGSFEQLCTVCYHEEYNKMEETNHA